MAQKIELINDETESLIKLSAADFLCKFWDFIDEDQTATRKEYTEAEQNELIQKFLLTVAYNH